MSRCVCVFASECQQLSICYATLGVERRSSCESTGYFSGYSGYITCNPPFGRILFFTSGLTLEFMKGVVKVSLFRKKSATCFQKLGSRVKGRLKFFQKIISIGESAFPISSLVVVVGKNLIYLFLKTMYLLP